METSMEQRVMRMAHRTWDIIGSDVLEMNMFKDMSGKDVAEIVADADYMKTNGGDKEAYEWFQKQTREIQKDLMQKAFPHRWYGV